MVRIASLDWADGHEGVEKLSLRCPKSAAGGTSSQRRGALSGWVGKSGKVMSKFIITLISGLFLLIQGAPVATSGFSSRAWVNTETGMIASTDANLSAPWKRMSAFQPRNGVTVAG